MTLKFRTITLALTAALLMLASALAAHGHVQAPSTTDAQPSLAPLALAEQLSVRGGGCIAGCDDGDTGGGGSSGGRDGSDPVGSAYWEQSGRTLLSRGHSGTNLGSKFNNYSDTSVTKTFSYTRRTVRSVEFSGGWASAFKAKIGGEIDQSTTDSVRYSIPPWHTGKLYYKHWTERYTVYGTRYQDYSDGSREVLARDDGPYRSTFTETSYVSSSLN